MVFEELFFNENDVEPCAKHTDLRDEAQTVIVTEPSIGTTMNASPDKNQFFVSSLATVLVDTVSYHNLIPGHTYVAEGRLMDKATGRVLVGGNGEITGKTIFVPTSSDGSVDVYFTFDSSALFGKTVVAFETVSYDGNIIAKHEDINDVDQSATFYMPELSDTTAENGEGGGKFIDAAGNVVIRDTVKYEHLSAKHDYRLRGTLVYQASGEPVLLNGKPVVVEKSFTAKKAYGSIDMEFTFDATGMQGKDIVVFEELFYEQQSVAVASHKDLDDEGQTVTVAKPTVKTTASNKADGSKMLEPEKKVTILDTVSFTGLIDGHTYKVSGTLMDKATGKPVVDAMVMRLQLRRPLRQRMPAAALMLSSPLLLPSCSAKTSWYLRRFSTTIPRLPLTKISMIRGRPCRSITPISLVRQQLEHLMVVSSLTPLQT